MPGYDFSLRQEDATDKAIDDQGTKLHVNGQVGDDAEPNPVA